MAKEIRRRSLFRSQTSLRAVHHKAGCHNEVPSFTGCESPSGMQELDERGQPPRMGAVCEYLKRKNRALPAYVSLPNPLNVAGETGPGAGFPDRRYASFESRATPQFDAGAVLNDRPNPPVVRGTPRLEDSQLFGNSAVMATKRIAAGVRCVNVIWTLLIRSLPGSGRLWLGYSRTQLFHSAERSAAGEPIRRILT